MESILPSRLAWQGARTKSTVTVVQALTLALLQGVSELFPISSLGHTILIPALLGWHSIDRSAPSFLSFVVALHFGTALALVVFYRKQWLRITRALFTSVARGKLSGDRDERVGWLLVVGTIPVGLLGLLLEHPVRKLFGSASFAAIFLMINGVVMFAGEWLRQRQRVRLNREDRPIDQLSFAQGALVGFGQSFALLPGISRSGASIVAALLCDLDHEDAAEFSFLLATPVIAAAALLELPKLLMPAAHATLILAGVGAIVSGIAAYGSVAFLTRYFRTNDLRPFGWYCVLFGTLCFTLARLGVIH